MRRGSIAALFAACSCSSPADRPDGSTVLLEDDFESYALGETWQEGMVYGKWSVVYASGGTLGIETDGSQAFTEAPAAATMPSETHAPLIVTTQTFSGDLEVTVRMKTVAQLRTGSTPNTWETAWLQWHASAPTAQANYFVLKTNGWELGKGLGQPPDNQEFLATGNDPKVQLGAWQRVRIVQVGPVITVYVDDVLVTSVTDAGVKFPVFTSGQVALYNEDAHTHFDDVVIRRP